MRSSMIWTLFAGVLLAGTWGLSSYGQGDVTKAVKTARGGLLVTTPQHQFEVFFFRTGVRVFPQTGAGQPVDITGATGTATFYHPNSPQPWFSRPLIAKPGQPGSLDLAIGLTNAPASGAKVEFEVTGLAGAGDAAAKFNVPLEFVQQTASRTTAPQGNVASVPRYTYVPGYYGYRYYPYSSPTAASLPASAYYGYASPSQHYRGDGDSVGPGHRDWSTGRDSPLAKPWLRPMD
jgi:hypothetical protein